MIETVSEYCSLLENLREMSKEKKLNIHLQGKLEAFEEVENLIDVLAMYKINMNELRKEYHNKTAGQIGEKARDLQTSYFTDEYVFWLEDQLKQLRTVGFSKCACDNIDDIQPYYDIEADIFRCDKCDKHF